MVKTYCIFCRLYETNLICWSANAADSILSKNEKIILQIFWFISFLDFFFYSLFLLKCFLFLDKTYNNQNQEGFIIFQKCSPKCRKFYRKTRVLETVFNEVARLQTFRPVSLLRRDSNIGVFPWNLWNFQEHLFWRTSEDSYWSLNETFRIFSIKE